MHKLKTNVQCLRPKTPRLCTKAGDRRGSASPGNISNSKVFPHTPDVGQGLPATTPGSITRALFPGSHGQAPSNHRRLREWPRGGYPRSSAPRGLRISGAPVPPHTRLLAPTRAPSQAPTHAQRKQHCTGAAPRSLSDPETLGPGRRPSGGRIQ